MLSKIVELFNQATEAGAQPAPLSDEQKRLACAALLIEVAIVDNEFDARELACLQQALESQFDISQQQSSELATLAHSEASDATSMYQFTQLVNQHCNEQEKFDLVTAMWSVAYADGELDKYEEYIIRKASDLLYVAHGDFIRAKHIAKQKLPK